MTRVIFTLMFTGLSAATATAQYTQGTVFAIRVGVTTSSVNVGGANVVNGVNIAPFQFTAGSWQPGAALSASPVGSGALTMSATATSEGALTVNGNYLGLAGYRTGTNSSGTDRVVVRVDLATGSFSTAAAMDTATSFTNAEGYTANNIRGAVWSTDGQTYWTSGTSSTTSGVRTGSFNTISGGTSVSNVPANVRTVNIFNGQLYSGSSTATGGNFRGINTVGTGLPTASGTTSTSLIDLTGNSTYGISISADSLTAYLADDRAIASGGGIQKWTRPDTSSAFTLASTFGTGAGSTVGARGLSVDYSGTSPVLYVSTAEASNNRIITFSDVAGTQTGLATIASSGTTDVFRGVAYTPGVIPEPALLGFIGLAGIALLRRRMS